MTPGKDQVEKWLALAGFSGFYVPAIRGFHAAYDAGRKAGLEEAMKIIARMDSPTKPITASNCIVAIYNAMQGDEREIKEKPE